jgi:hypothetical protein
MHTVKNCDFSNVVEIQNSNDNFYLEVIGYFSILFKMHEGFDLYFFEEKKFELEAINENVTNPNDPIPIIRSFDQFHCILLENSAKLRKIRLQKEKLTKKQHNINQEGSKKERVMAFFESLGYKRSTDGPRLNEFLAHMKNYRSVSVGPTVVSHYKVIDGKAVLVSNERHTFGRIRSGNYLYLSTSQKDFRMVYSGVKIAPRIGNGQELIWKKARIKWKVFSSKNKWIS